MVALALALALAAMAVTPHDVRVTVRAGPGSAPSCTLRDAAWVPAPERLAREASVWRWRQMAGDVLTCSSPGFEPAEVDSSAAALPPEVVLALPPAREVTLQAGWGGVDTVVEWRAPGDGRSILVARRRLTLGDRLTLPVATQTRVLRLRPLGLSPISLLVPAGNGAATLEVPRPTQGGEVFGRLPRRTYLPEALELGLGRRREVLIPDIRGVFSFAGLPPGSYLLTPRYRGGVTGEPRTLEVRLGETAELLPLPLPETGAVLVRVAPGVCRPEGAPWALRLRRVEEEGRRVERRARFEETIQAPPCDRELAGLEPGTYQVELGGWGAGREAPSSARFVVRAGEGSSVALRHPAVQVKGDVTFAGGRPASGLPLRFERDGEVWDVRTDAAGAYAVTLGSAGAYVVSVRASSGVPSASFVRELASGAQRADFVLAETSLVVRVVREEPSPAEEPVEVTLTARDGRRITGRGVPEQEGGLRFVGLDYGTYWVTAGTPSGLGSVTEVQVELSPESPAAEADLVLGRLRGRLRVVDWEGRPARAEVRAGAVTLKEEEPGTFGLAGVAEGEWLQVRAAGHAPACRVLRRGAVPEVTLALQRPSESVRLHVASSVPWESGLVSGLPGSDCPVHVAEVGTVTSLGHQRTTVLLRLPPGRFEFAVGAARYPLVVPGPDVSVTRPTH